MPSRDEILQKAAESLEEAIANKVKDNKFKQEREYLVERVSKEISSTFKPFLDDIRATLKRAVDDIKVTVPPIEVPEAKIPDIHIPEIKVPDIVIPPSPEVKLPPIVVPEIKIPEIKLPTINVPQPKVTVNVPPFPEIKWPTSNLPVEGWLHLMGVDLDHPLPVQLRDKDGKPFNPFAELTQVIGGGGGFRQVSVDDYLGSTIPVMQVSGANWSVDIASQSSTLDVRQVSGANWSVDIALQSTTLDVRQVSGNVYSVYANNAVGQGDSATALRTIQAGDSVSSVYANNPVAQGDSATALRVIHAGDAVASVYANNPSGQGDTATALRIVHAGDSAVSVSATQVGTWAQNLTQLAGTALPVGDELITPGQLRVYHVANAGLSAYVRPQAVGFETTTDVLRILQVGDSATSCQAKVVAMTTNPAAAADAASTFLKSDKIGRMAMTPYQVRDLVATAFISLATGAGYNTETVLIPIGAAGVFNDILQLSGTNDSTVAAVFDLRCGTANANISKRISIPAAANGMYHEDFNVPLLGEVTTPWTVKAFISGGGAADITGNNVSIHASFVKNI